MVNIPKHQLPTVLFRSTN